MVVLVPYNQPKGQDIKWLCQGLIIFNISSRMHTAEDVFIRDLPDLLVIGNQPRVDREGA